MKKHFDDKFDQRLKNIETRMKEIEIIENKVYNKNESTIQQFEEIDFDNI